MGNYYTNDRSNDIESLFEKIVVFFEYFFKLSELTLYKNIQKREYKTILLNLEYSFRFLDFNIKSGWVERSKLKNFNRFMCKVVYMI